MILGKNKKGKESSVEVLLKNVDMETIQGTEGRRNIRVNGHGVSLMIWGAPASWPDGGEAFGVTVTCAASSNAKGLRVEGLKAVFDEDGKTLWNAE